MIHRVWRICVLQLDDKGKPLHFISLYTTAAGKAQVPFGLVLKDPKGFHVGTKEEYCTSYYAGCSDVHDRQVEVLLELIIQDKHIKEPYVWPDFDEECFMGNETVVHEATILSMKVISSGNMTATPGLISRPDEFGYIGPQKHIVPQLDLCENRRQFFLRVLDLLELIKQHPWRQFEGCLTVAIRETWDEPSTVCESSNKPVRGIQLYGLWLNRLCCAFEEDVEDFKRNSLLNARETVREWSLEHHGWKELK